MEQQHYINWCNFVGGIVISRHLAYIIQRHYGLLLPPLFIIPSMKLSSLKVLAGLYLFTNSHLVGAYLGSSVDFFIRFYKHIRHSSNPTVRGLMSAYGYTSFVIYAVDLVFITPTFTKELLLSYENCFIQSSNFELLWNIATSSIVFHAGLVNDKQLLVFDLETGIFTIYSSANAFGRLFQISSSSLAHPIRNGSTYKGRFLMCYFGCVRLIADKAFFSLTIKALKYRGLLDSSSRGHGNKGQTKPFSVNEFK